MAIDFIIQWITDHPNLAGFTIFLVALTESLAVVGIVVPGAFTMWAAGSLIALEILSFWPIFIWSVCGAFMGDSLSYLLGKIYHQQLRDMWPFRNHPQWLDRGQDFFEKHGVKSLVLGRFVGPIRPFVPLVAGMMDMGSMKFVITNGLSALVWAPAYLLPGYLVGASLAKASPLAGRLTLLLLLIFFTAWALLWLILRAIEITHTSSHKIRDFIRLYNLSWEVRWSAWIGGLGMVSLFALYLLLGGIPAEPLPSSSPTAQNWWHDEWQQSPAYHPGTLYTEPNAFNVQYFGDIENLRTTLERLGWLPSTPVNLPSLLHVLLPAPTIQQLPVFRKQYYRQPPQLSYIYSDPLVSNNYLFRLWPYATQNGIVRLWLGSVHEITVKNYIYFFSLIASPRDALT
ncbi:MAG TPA: hypothetical protein DCZ03_07300, partial [Gammaproteobacteria bacterium]|nr:hypothetical protein [Gammaproteobacteria bacterium]